MKTEGSGRQRIKYTRHARRRMKWRGISEREIKETLEMPDRRESCGEKRINAFKSLGRKLIKVSYVVEDETIVIISVVDKNA
ncbi:MAG: DUF4258 domain-containing protein [bacterium]